MGGRVILAQARLARRRRARQRAGEQPSGRVTLPEEAAVVLLCHGDTLWPSGPIDLCGVPVVKPADPGSNAQTLRCEHMDLVIPLNATSRLSSAALEERYEWRVQEALARARLEGWHAEDPIDWASTRQAGRLTGHIGLGFLGFGQPRYVYESVTIRLTRHRAAR